MILAVDAMGGAHAPRASVEGAVAAAVAAARTGADWIRTHEVKALRDGLSVEEALGRDGID